MATLAGIINPPLFPSAAAEAGDETRFLSFFRSNVYVRSLCARGICCASQWEKGACGRDCFTVYSSGEFGTVGNKLRRKTLSWRELSPTYIPEKMLRAEV